MPFLPCIFQYYINDIQFVNHIDQLKIYFSFYFLQSHIGILQGQI